MLEAFFNIFRIPELRRKLLFTMSMLVIYRIGFWIPLPAINQGALRDIMENQQGSATADLALFMSMFSGGSLMQSTLFALGIMPYITAAIIFQLLQNVVPTLEQLKKEGPAGQQKIQEYTRYTTVGLCIIQAVFLLSFLSSQPNMIYPEWAGTPTFWLSGIMGMTAGTIFLMWLGEQIDKYGIGNGASLIITAGIIAQMPNAILTIANKYQNELVVPRGEYGVLTILLLLAMFLLVVGGSVLITQGQRRIPVQQAKHTRGRKVYGGQRSYVPLRVNHGGVMPIIFASALLMLPSIVLRGMASQVEQATTEESFVLWRWMSDGFGFLANQLQMGEIPYELVYIGLIYFFAYFWTSVQFQPREMATQLRDHGSFIPGLRPGPRTADYLERVMERITYVGAGFLCVIAVVPSLMYGIFKVDFMVASFLGGTGLLITVSVMLDFVQRIEANLMMRNYRGFLGGGGTGGGGPRIRGR